MANTLGTVATAAISQETLKALLEELSWLTSLSTTYSDSQVSKGQNLILRVPSVGTAQDFSSGTGYVAEDATLTDATITLDQHKFAGYAVTDAERDSSLINLVDAWANANAHALGKSVVEYIIAALVSAGTSNTSVIAAGSFGLDDLIDVGSAMDADNIPTGGRWALIPPAYHAALEKDIGTTGNFGNSTFSVDATITNGALGQLRGFQIYKSSLTTNLYFGVKETVGVLTAVPALPEVGNTGGDISYVVEPNSGLTVQSRSHYDNTLAQLNNILTLYFGASVLRSDTLHEVTPS